MSKVIDKVVALTENLFDEENFELVDLSFVKEGKNWYLRFAIDHDGGVTIDDCALMSEKIGDILDSTDPDPIPQTYFLEVSSPGAERPLKTIEAIKNAVGKYVNISFYQAIDGEKWIEGILEQANDEVAIVSYYDKTRLKQLEIPQSNIAKARLAIKF